MPVSPSFRCIAFHLVLIALSFSVVHPATAARDSFVPLFDGKSLDGWVLMGGSGPGYVVRNGLLVCPSDGGGNLFTRKEYSDFKLRLDFRLDPGGNNGVGIRAPLDGDAAYVGMELQILDDNDPQYANLDPGQYCSSIYRVVPAKRGAVKKPGEWNREEITALGRRITIRLNGKTVVDANLNDVHDPAVIAEHPGMLRDRGHIGLLGHGPSVVAFRNIEVEDLARPERENTPPDGFTALFDGKELKGWKGLVADPPSRAKMSRETLAAEQAKADQRMRDHWSVVDGVITFDGKGDSLCTAKDYRDFEMLVDWKIPPAGDSGIYLRGSPQVQIWDPANAVRFGHAPGSGGLYNNEKHPNDPTKNADRPIGEWNRFRIVMIGDKVTVYENGELVTHNVTMENYWERSRPIYRSGQVELQNHGGPLWFKNVFIREIDTGLP